MENNRIRILLVEDDYLVCEEIKRTLRDSQYSVIGEASTGVEAIQHTKDLAPDVILMDIKMPVMNGLEASRLIQEQCPTPIVILTAHESKDLLEQASQVGAGSYLTKPPRLIEIERAVTIAVARHKDLMTMKQLYEQLKEAHSHIKVLQGFLPICSFCKKIRDDKGYWQQLEVYISIHSEALFTHSYCPNCLEEHFPEYKPAKRE
jgi:DNA-binding NarL/FixJ family response regulator